MSCSVKVTHVDTIGAKLLNVAITLKTTPFNAVYNFHILALILGTQFLVAYYFANWRIVRHPFHVASALLTVGYYDMWDNFTPGNTYTLLLFMGTIQLFYAARNHLRNTATRAQTDNYTFPGGLEQFNFTVDDDHLNLTQRDITITLQKGFYDYQSFDGRYVSYTRHVDGNAQPIKLTMLQFEITYNHYHAGQRQLALTTIPLGDHYGFATKFGSIRDTFKKLWHDDYLKTIFLEEEDGHTTSRRTRYGILKSITKTAA